MSYARERICRYCKGKGIIRVRYTSKESDDLAVCDCRAGLWYRKAGVAVVKRRLKLTDETIRVAWREDFIDVSTPDPDEEYRKGLLR